MTSRARLYAIAGVAAAAVVVIAIVVARSGDEGADTRQKPFEPDATVSAVGGRYSDGEIVLTVGAAVAFENDDRVPHTFTADDGRFDSRVVEPGKRYGVTLDRPGTVAFHCEIHPTMRGTIVVNAPTGP